MAENIRTEATGHTEAKRPSISLPPRPSDESLFRLEPAEASPNPMNLVSSFFSEDPESDCRSFSQLLAGAITLPETRTTAEAATGEGRGRGGGLNLGQSQAMNLLAGQSPFFMAQSDLSPGGLLDFPAIFSSNLMQGQLGLAHQQASHSQLQMHLQSENPSSLFSASLSRSFPTVKMPKVLHMPATTLDSNAYCSEVASASHSDQVPFPVPIVVDKPVDDGYNWRKYGQKQVKGSEYPRSYYKCTQPNCPVKKKVERSVDGQVTEIIYKGKHNHQKPPSNKRGKEANMPNGSAELNGHIGFLTNSESHSQGNAITGLSKRDRESGNVAYDQLSGSSDGEEVGDHEGMDERDYGESDQKKRNLETKLIESASHRTVTEARIIVQTTSEVDLLDDGYRWRKYGQKVVKGNPHPRSYYKCTNAGCSVRKHVERASKDPKAVITTYEGKHNHDVPAARNSSHSTAAAASNSSKPQNIHGRSDPLNNVHRPIAVFQLKEEREIM
ncbi:probable WRKY transcription factor 4 isoform X1 [Dendrobium catenatum]|uniref:probable WRKY transcription factor 4 isoform X1 n=1 Tax=Dendrobium catenatum TaxID=906689 RepID=UPI0009F736EA|nr:probable WRKY transcription factor 4 isoform X1 [Dendrobium catenatum]